MGFVHVFACFFNRCYRYFCFDFVLHFPFLFPSLFPFFPFLHSIWPWFCNILDRTSRAVHNKDGGDAVPCCFAGFIVQPLLPQNCWNSNYRPQMSLSSLSRSPVRRKIWSVVTLDFLAVYLQIFLKKWCCRERWRVFSPSAKCAHEPSGWGVLWDVWTKQFRHASQMVLCHCDRSGIPVGRRKKLYFKFMENRCNSEKLPATGTNFRLTVGHLSTIIPVMDLGNTILLCGDTVLFWSPDCNTTHKWLLSGVSDLATCTQSLAHWMSNFDQKHRSSPRPLCARGRIHCSFFATMVNPSFCNAPTSTVPKVCDAKVEFNLSLGVQMINMFDALCPLVDLCRGRVSV